MSSCSTSACRTWTVEKSRERSATTCARDVSPLVALSALRYGGDHDALSAEGFAGYLEKPIDVQAFPGQVRSYCT